MILTPRVVVRLAAETYGVDTGELLGRSQGRWISNPRLAVAWVMRHTLEMSFPWIGRELGRDHSTIMHAVREAEENRDIGDLIEELLEAIDKWEPDRRYR